MAAAPPSYGDLFINVGDQSMGFVRSFGVIGACLALI
jgi:hypothetical protein